MQIYTHLEPNYGTILIFCKKKEENFRRKSANIFFFFLAGSFSINYYSSSSPKYSFIKSVNKVHSSGKSIW